MKQAILFSTHSNRIPIEQMLYKAETKKKNETTMHNFHKFAGKRLDWKKGMEHKELQLE